MHQKVRRDKQEELLATHIFAVGLQWIPRKKNIVVRACSSMYFMKIAVDYLLVTEKFDREICNGLLQ